MSISRSKICFCSTEEQLCGYCGLAIAGDLGIQVALSSQSYFVTKACGNVDSCRAFVQQLGWESVTVPSNGAIGAIPSGATQRQNQAGWAAKCGLRSKDTVGAGVCGSSQELPECVLKKSPRGGLALKAGNSVRHGGTQAWITECLTLALHWTHRPFSLKKGPDRDIGEIH